MASLGSKIQLDRLCWIRYRTPYTLRSWNLNLAKFLRCERAAPCSLKDDISWRIRNIEGDLKRYGVLTAWLVSREAFYRPV